MSDAIFGPLFVHGSATSEAAARRVAPRVKSQRARILEFLKEHGPATDHDIGAALGLSGDSVRPRRFALVVDGLVVRVDEKGITASGNEATRWGLR